MCQRPLVEGVEDMGEGEDAALMELDLCGPPSEEALRLMCRMGLGWWDKFYVSVRCVMLQ